MSKQVFEPKQNWNQFRVQVKALSLTNFKGFRNIELDFNEKLTVLISKNGGGKTSILDAVWADLVQFGIQVFKQSHPKSILSRFDVNNQADSDSAQIELLTHIDIQWWEARDYGEEGETNLELAQTDTIIRLSQTLNRETEGKSVTFTEESTGSEGYYPVWGVLKRHFTSKTQNRTDSRPLFRYYRVEDQRHSNDILSTKGLQAWVDKRQKLVMLSGKSYPSYQAEWDWVNKAISEMLSDENNSYKNLRVDYRPNGDFLILDKITEDSTEVLSVEQLSSGERSLLSIVTDIVLGLIEQNPSNNNTPLQDGFGVVLIDEVGIHLHPSWQRRVLGVLTKLFPKIQFIVSTHSPLVVSGIRQEQGRLIKNFQCYPIGKVTGRDAASILEDEFGEQERPLVYQEKINQFYRLLDRNRDEAEEVLNELKQIWPENDEEIIRAESYLDIF